MMKLIKFTLAATALTFASPAVLAETSAPVDALAQQTQITAKVNGMVCDFCARAVTKVFSQDDAVEAVNVDLDTGEIQVTLKAGADLTDETVADLVTKSGYDLVSVSRASA